MFRNTKTNLFLTLLFTFSNSALLTTIDRDVINKINLTTCFRSHGNIDETKAHADIRSVDGNRFYSFLAKIGWTSPAGKVSFHCGGTLISDNFVLSAAHCMDYERPMYKNKPDIVRIAEHAADGKTLGEDIQISGIYIHPLYGVNSMYDDIALIELSKSSRHHPACIWHGAVVPTMSLFALGHDLRTTGAQQVMNLKFVNSGDCDRRYSPSRKLPHGILNSQICAGKSNITEGEMCKGFIGGPLLTQGKEKSDEFFVLGLTNFGQRCASSEFPNIYTKLSFYKDWIDETVNEK